MQEIPLIFWPDNSETAENLSAQFPDSKIDTKTRPLELDTKTDSLLSSPFLFVPSSR